MDFIRSGADPCSFANPEEARVIHADLELEVDFDSKVLKGKVILTIERKCFIEKIILDNHELVISSVTNASKGTPLKYSIVTNPANPAFGTSLHVDLSQFIGTTYNPECKIEIKYTTRPNSPALYWLTAAQTADGLYPFLLSNNKLIYARSWFPCQDTPSVKFTYSAKIWVRKPFTVLMSALSRDIHKSHPELNVHEFRQEKPVPSYAVVIAVGSLRERECNKRISIFAEEKTFQSHVDRFRYKAIENMLVYAEHNLCGPYTWGRYDICVLPPSIAHFEIECPCVTFVSPLLLGGDSSYIVSSLARNISQSWAGNLVTCCNYEHLWLNKSFSIFISRKIKRKMLYHEDIDVFLQREGLKNLNSLIPRKPADAVLLRCLLPNLKGTSELPHIITKYVPYERGYFLLCHLEHILGGPTVFEPFLQSYFNDFSRQSINTTDWLNYLRQKFLDKVELLDGVEWRVWFNRIFFTFSMPVMTLWEEKCFTLAEKLIKYETRDVLPLTADVNNLHDVQKIILLKCLHSSHRRLTTETLNSIPASFFHYSRNYEIRYLWLLLCIKVRCDEKVKPALKFAVKYCSPNYACCIFKYLCKWEIMRPQTMRIFHENEEKMLDETREKLNKILYPSNLFLSELV